MLTVSRLIYFALLIITTAWAISPGSAVAQEMICRQTQVFFVNGVWNPSPIDPRLGAAELRQAMTEAGISPTITPRVIWNPGDGKLADIIEVASSSVWPKKSASYVYDLIGRIAPQVAILFKDELDATKAGLRNRVMIDEIKLIVLHEIRVQKNPVLIVAHSQGNILVNQAVKELQIEGATMNIPGIGSIGIVGVGVPDNMGAGVAYDDKTLPFYRYITASLDRIITPLEDELPANFDSKFIDFAGDIFDHELIGTYLNRLYTGKYVDDSADTTSRIKIPQLFLSVYERLQSSWPCTKLSITPTPIKKGDKVSFTVDTISRPGQFTKSQGTVSIVGDGGVFCSEPLNAEGRATCSYTDKLRPRTVEVKTYFSDSSGPRLGLNLALDATKVNFGMNTIGEFNFGSSGSITMTGEKCGPEGSIISTTTSLEANGSGTVTAADDKFVANINLTRVFGSRAACGGFTQISTHAIPCLLSGGKLLCTYSDSSKDMTFVFNVTDGAGRVDYHHRFVHSGGSHTGSTSGTVVPTSWIWPIGDFEFNAVGFLTFANVPCGEGGKIVTATPPFESSGRGTVKIVNGQFISEMDVVKTFGASSRICGSFVQTSVAKLFCSRSGSTLRCGDPAYKGFSMTFSNGAGTDKVVYEHLFEAGIVSHTGTVTGNIATSSWQWPF